DVSGIYFDGHVGNLQSKQRGMDLASRNIDINAFNFSNSSIKIRMEKVEEAKEVITQVKQEIIAQEQAGWNIKAGSVVLDNDTILLDNNIERAIPYGIDFNHLYATGLILH